MCTAETQIAFIILAELFLWQYLKRHFLSVLIQHIVILRMKPKDAPVGVPCVGLFVAASEEPETGEGFAFGLFGLLGLFHMQGVLGGMLAPKSDAKVGVLGRKRSHKCDLFVTFCDLMKIVAKMHKKSDQSGR